MAKGKKSFILYSDQRIYFDKLTDTQAGRLIKHIFAYVNDEHPEAGDIVIDLSFEPIKQSLKRDLQKWGEIREMRAEIGRKGGLAKASKGKQKLAKGSKAKQTVANVAVNDTVSVNDTVNISFDQFWDLYGKKVDRPKCEKKWGKLKDNDRASIIAHIPLYKQQTPDKQFRKNPYTYLNNRSWENEVTNDKGQTAEDRKAEWIKQAML